MPASQMGAVVGGNGRRSHRWRALLAALAVVLVVASIPAAAWAIPARVPPTQTEDGTDPAAGETIADGRARLPRGEIAWTIRRIDVPGAAGVTVETFPTGFALVDEGTVALSAEDDEEPTQLAAGEAAVLPDRKAGSLVAVEGDSAGLYEIALVSSRDVESGEALGAVVGAAFPAPEGEAFDIELIRNTLTGEDEATIPVSGSGTPVFYLTTDGTAQLTAGEQTVDLAAGQFALLAGAVQVRAAGDAPATFVVAAIGEEAAAREPGDREARAERQREPRQRAGGGGGQGNTSAGGQGEGDRAARRAARQAARQAQGGGGGGGRGGQSQQQGTGGTGGAPVTGAEATATIPVPVGTPSAEPTVAATLPADPTVPADGTPPPAETPPIDETVVPTATVPAAETPTPEPTVPVVPTNPPVPDVPGVPGVPTVPAEETVVTEAVPTVEEPALEEAPPVEEAPAAPVEEEQDAESIVEE